uniref:NFACT RNA-binding domain-containing protein n=1 Tax=Photinus pyralis TaxID=7054 RepID=A0A1Y1MZR1_PHOPY
MKTRFNSFDILCSVTELQKLIGMRVNNIYDIDNKTYLIKLQRTEEKSVLLLESGNRIHTTNFEWPKNIAPSGFSMKLRKHLKNKRLEKLTQIGLDRIVILQFGTGEAAYHVILELYDRGNILLTDYEMTILNVLRPHTEGDKVKFAVREKYPENRGRESNISNVDDLRLVLDKGKVGDPIKKVLMMNLDYGPSLIEHVLLKSGFANSTKLGKSFEINTDIERLFSAIEEAKQIVEVAKTQNCKGFLIQKREEKPTTDPNAPKEYLYSNQEFHPMLYSQHISEPYQEFDTFNLAVDEFYSTFESQKIELRGLQQEKEALKKLDNIKKDHDHRLTELEKAQETDKQKAELITRNQELVDNAILAIQSALASQVSCKYQRVKPIVYNIIYLSQC